MPVTSTASEKETVIVIVSSFLYNPSAVVAVTLLIVGAVVSTVKDNVEDADDVLPAASVAVVVNE